MKRSLLILLTIASLCSLIVGLTACAGGKTAYDIYKDTYFETKGDYEGVLSEEEWLESLHGVDGVGIEKIDIVCGDVIIYFDDDSTKILKSMLPEAGHNWDSGVVTTASTCISPGINTYTCEDCKATKTELLDSNGEHHWGDFSYNNDYHWRTCKICGEVEKHEHDFGENISKDNVDEILECECSIYQTVGEFFSYKIVFECGEGVSVLIYETQDYTADGLASTIAYSRDGDNGELLNNGDGQVNFEVVVDLGYKLKGITISQKNYKNLKDPSETNRDNTYRITKITGELTVTIETEIVFLDLPVMIINTENSAPILDKENYVTSAVSILNTGEEYCFEEVVAGVRGRGNYTWTLDKKGYRIKFNKKQNLLGDYKCKSWVLLPNYTDKTLLRNYLAFSIAQEMDGLEWTPNTHLIELYLNSEYLGVYLLTDQVQVDENRVNIEESSLNVDTGYFIERDVYAWSDGKIQGKDFFIIEEDYGDVPYVLKSPEYPSQADYDSEEAFENAVSIYMAQFNYIKDYITNAFMAIKSGDYEQFKELCDEDSFVDYFLIDQIFLNWEIDRYSSFYLYKDAGGKLFVGPIWDFDIGAGYADPNPEQDFWSCNTWFYPLLTTDFKNVVIEHLVSYSDMIFSKVENLDLIISESCLAIERNNIRWPIGYVYPMNTELSSLTTYEEHVDFLKNFIVNRVNFLIQTYSS